MDRESTLKQAPHAVKEFRMALPKDQLKTLNDESLTREYRNAYDHVQGMREKWGKNIQDMPAADEASWRTALDQMQNCQEESTRRTKLKADLARNPMLDPDFGSNEPVNFNIARRATDGRQSPQNRLQRRSKSQNGFKSPKAFRAQGGSGITVPRRTVVNYSPDNNPNTVVFGEEETAGFESLLRNRLSTRNVHTPEVQKYLSKLGEVQNTFRTSDPQRAGMFVVPEEWWAGLLHDVDDQTVVQGLSKVMNITALTLGIRMRLSKASMISWGSENSDASNNPENGLTYGKRTMTPGYCTGLLKMSNDLLANASIDILGEVRREIAIDMREFTEDLFINSTGVGGRPVGLLYAATAGEGISTSRDVAFGSGTFSETNLIDMLTKLKTAYVSNSNWMMHRYRVGDLAKMKGSDGHPLWRPSMQLGFPSLLLGRPIQINDYFPTATSSGVYGMMLADFQYYWIVYRGTMAMQTLQEVYALTNETAYIYRFMLDAMPILEEAFVRGAYA
jgi:HK97 family phage major capsid protein